MGSWTANEKVASLTRVPPPPTCRVSQLTAGAFAPHRAFVNFARNVTLRVARIPRVRSLLRRKWPIWGRILLKNKMRAEVTSYRMAVNEAWEALEGTLPQDTLAAMREAESVVAGYGYGVQSQSGGGGGGGGGGTLNAYAYDDGGGGGGGFGGGGLMSSDGRGAGVFNRRDGGGGETDYYGEALSGMIRRRSSGRLNGRLGRGHRGRRARARRRRVVPRALARGLGKRRRLADPERRRRATPRRRRGTSSSSPTTARTGTTGIIITSGDHKARSRRSPASRKR